MLLVPYLMDLIQGPFPHGHADLKEVRAKLSGDHFPFRVAVPHVDLEYPQAVIRVQVQAEVKDAFVSPAKIIVNGVDRGVYDLFDNAVDQPGAHQLVGAVTPGTTGVEVSTEFLDGFCIFRVKGGLIILGKHPEGHHMMAVEINEKGNLRPVHPLFNDNPASRFPECFLDHDGVNRRFGIVDIIAYDCPFSCGQAVGLDHHLITDISNILLCLVRIIKHAVLWFGDTDFQKEIVCESAVAFQTDISLFRADRSDTAPVQEINQTFLKGVFRSYIHQIHPVLGAEPGDLLEVPDRHPLNKPPFPFGGLQHSWVSRCEIYLVDVLAVPILVSKTVISTA